jgi:hypothetical protein
VVKAAASYAENRQFDSDYSYMSKTLYTTGLTSDGYFLIGGIYRMKDELGFPLDASLDYCIESGNLVIDWCECLADAGSQKDWKFDSVLEELEMLLNKNTKEETEKKFYQYGNYIMCKYGTKTFIETCEKILELKRDKSYDTKRISNKST